MRQNATADSKTRTEGVGVREFRPARRDPDARKAEGYSEAEETDQSEEVVTIRLPRRSRLGPLPYWLFLAGELVRHQTAARHLRAHNSDAFRVSELSPVVIVTEKLLIKIPEQVERLHADVCVLQLPFHQIPEVLFGIRVDVAPNVLKP